MNIEKSTGELLKNLENTENIKKYIEETKDEQLEMSLSEFLNELLVKYNKKQKDVIKSAEINQVYACQIFSGQKKSYP